MSLDIQTLSVCTNITYSAASFVFSLGVDDDVVCGVLWRCSIVIANGPFRVWLTVVDNLGLK